MGVAGAGVEAVAAVEEAVLSFLPALELSRWEIPNAGAVSR